MAQKTTKNPIGKKKQADTGQLANLTKGFIKENPIFIFLLGLCPALAVTSTVETSLGMGLLVVFVLVLSNVVISLIKGFIPKEVKIPAYIVVISTFVTVVGLLTEAYAYELFRSLGIFIPLIVANCLILGRAESFASKNNVFSSAVDGLGMALGFTFAMVLIGFFREFLSSGAIGYGVYLPPGVEGNIVNLQMGPFEYLLGMDVFAGPAGGFIVIGVLLAIFNAVRLSKEKKEHARKQAFIEQKKREAAERKRKKAMESGGEQA